MQCLGDQTFAGAIFAGDEDVCVGRTDARDHVQHGPHRGRLRDQIGSALAAQKLVLLFQAAIGANGVAEVDLVADDRDQTGILPRFRDEIPRAAPHRLDRDIDAGPSGHHDHGQGGVNGLDLVEQVEAFLAGRGVALVIEVHQHEREVAGLDGLDDRRRRLDRFNLVAFRLEQETQRFEDVGLIVGN